MGEGANISSVAARVIQNSSYCVIRLNWRKLSRFPGGFLEYKKQRFRNGNIRSVFRIPFIPDFPVLVYGLSKKDYTTLCSKELSYCLAFSGILCK